MLNKLKRGLLVSCYLFLYGLSANYCLSAQLDNAQISGIDGDVLLNVQRRLAELNQDQSITNESSGALQLQIEKAMYPYGYFKSHVTITPSDHKNPLRIHITAGPQLLITTLTVTIKGEGLKDPKINQALHDLPIKVGQPLYNAAYEEAKDKLMTAARNQGYLHASFETSKILIDQQQYTANINLLFDTGHQYYFGQVRFNPTYISPALLRRYVPFRAGQPYSTEKIQTLNSNLAASGYFKTTNVKPSTQKNDHVPIDVQLQASKRISYSLGAGYGTDTGPRGLAALHVIPVNRLGHKFNAIAQGSFEENALQAQYIIPGFNPVIDNYSLSGGATNLDYNSGHSNALLLSLAQQHVRTDYQRILSINGLNDRYNYTDYNTTIKSLIYPKAIFSWNKTSDPLFSPSGYNVTINGLAATKALLSQVNMAQIAIDAKVAFTVDIIRTRLYLHAIQGATLIDDVNQIPLSIAQLLGGSGNLKGYNYNSLGPGKIISYGGVEIQKETFKKWYLLGFVDGGDVYNPDEKDFKYDVGVGLMWVSPIGPIKIGLAQAIDHNFERIQERSPKLVINMGPDLS